MFGTSYTQKISSLSSLLNNYITKNYDFGTVYGYLRPFWYNLTTIKDNLNIGRKKDEDIRQKALVGDRVIDTQIPPRRVWDLYSNRVVPCWVMKDRQWPKPISHAWMEETDRNNVWTPINGYEWPVSIPKDANLDLIRIEMLNLGVEYTWLDVLCLRQKDGKRDVLRVKEWQLDVATIGYLYRVAKVVVWYLSGLGRPLSLREGDLDSDRCWFRRAWTLQEIGKDQIIAGDTENGPLHAKPIDEKGNYKTKILTQFYKKLEALVDISIDSYDIFGILVQMRDRVSANPLDKITGLASCLESAKIPAYYENQSLEDAWTALVNTIIPWLRGDLFFLYPEPGETEKKWRPSWDQVITKPLPAKQSCKAWAGWNEETGEDWCEGHCIEEGTVLGLNMRSIKDADRCGKLIVDAYEKKYPFKVTAVHHHLIPEGKYTIISADITLENWVIGRRLPNNRFEKVSVLTLPNLREREKLKNLQIITKTLNFLV
ncbi:hypothetical protein IW261DRAFT_1346614 [Armillaria novae-zelandiae]|uniref:Heterokaryon incompatibility domain-containing protein n=1 Tax=Armillaria novae-zelandiae TaxID=153914 RepID=A0AA39NJ42_9AGAR|nr:hypothetical protein IW261DRAFT_1346614 [Armillaria novae-zelandiae]